MTNPLDSVLRVDLDKAGLSSDLTPAASAAGQGEMPFKDVLKNLVDKVASLQKDADVSLQGLVTGETTDIHNVAIKMEEAGVAFDLMMEVRNKLLEAYQEISKMQP